MKLLALFLAAAGAFAQIITSPNAPTNNPNQINVTTGYLYANKVHYAGTWSSAVTYNSQDLVLYSGGSYISIQVVNLNNNPASSALWWVPLPGSGGGGGATWGGITGTLSAQTDLVSALNLRLLASSNLSDVAAAATARSNLGLGSFTGARKANGASTDTQAACGDLSNAAASCSTDATNASNLASGTLPHGRLPTLLSGDIPNNAANTTGEANTAAALAATPTPCSAGSAPTGVLANGNSTGCLTTSPPAITFSCVSQGGSAVGGCNVDVLAASGTLGTPCVPLPDPANADGMMQCPTHGFVEFHFRACTAAACGTAFADPVKVQLSWNATTATSGAAGWQVALQCVSAGAAYSSSGYATATSFSSSTAAGTAGTRVDTNVASITTGCSPGDEVYGYFYLNTNTTSDTPNWKSAALSGAGMVRQ